MDMQNVSNLTIPEGEVRAIHDSNNRLLWGRVDYDTKYAGDISQQTYSGKNLYPGSQDFGGTWQRENEWVTETIKYNGLTVKSRSAAWGGIYRAINVDAGKTYTYSVYAKADSNRTADLYVTAIGDATATVSPSSLFNINLTTSWQRFSITFTVTSGGTVCPRIENNNSGITTYICGYQLEESSSMTDYEPYEGGPSPNPSHPQPIQVVTGTQTISIIDGANNHDFIVNLGSAEFVKIGNLQDKIFNNNPNGDWYNPNLEDNAWYVYKNIGKTIVTGSSSETWVTTDSQNLGDTFYGGVRSIDTTGPTDNAENGLFSNYFLQISNIWGGDDAGAQIIPSQSWYKLRFRIPKSDLASVDLDGMKDWFASHNTTVYYILGAPTYTKITDSTLISQLNAVHEWLTRYGYNATVSGNLPIVIDRTNL